jgi:glutathione synthase/RimK-type ligase-like ATP-grasp enzyme
MRTLREFRAGKPAFYPDQSIYAAFACAEFGLAFDDLDGGTGLVFRVSSPTKTVHIGSGRCSQYPQNGASASTLASDKYFTHVILERAGVPTLGGNYFFLRNRLRAYRPGGHEAEDARAYFRQLGGSAFVKPLTGSRGDFAQALHGCAALDSYLAEVSKVYDAILMQPVVRGHEYRVFLLDDEVLFCARKFPPYVLGDGARSLRALLTAHNEALRDRGLSPVLVTDDNGALDMILPAGARWDIPGRTNWSAGGTMVLDAPQSDAALALAQQAARALGLRVAAVDLFSEIAADTEANRVIEVNANPSIRLLEQQDRADLILKIWRHTFLSQGLLAP